MATLLKQMTGLKLICIFSYKILFSPFFILKMKVECK